VKIYAINADGSKGGLLGDTVTDGNGAYRAGLGKYQGAIVVEASGSYTDESTGAINTVPANAPLRAAVASLSGQVAIAVTPLTELAVQMGEDTVTHKISVADLASNNALIAAAFKVDILSTMPVDALAASTAATNAQKEHSLVLAAFAQMMQNKGTDLHTVIAEMKTSIGPDKKISVPVAAQFQAALAGFVASPANRTGITDVSTTPLINIGGSTKALTISVAGTAGLISGIHAVVYLPPGVTVKSASDGAVPNSALQLKGGALGNAELAVQYFPATGPMRGRVGVAVISAKGFVAGELLTLQCDLAPDAVPHDTDFSLLLLQGLDEKLGVLSNLTLTAKLAQ
jgi:hypothetical protein